MRQNNAIKINDNKQQEVYFLFLFTLDDPNQSIELILKKENNESESSRSGGGHAGGK
jgi:hypothetical protein